MLVFEVEDGTPIEVPLEGRIMLGSAEGCDVLVEAEGVEGQHAEIYPAPEGGYWVRDLRSAEGTFINGLRIEAQKLAPGDRLNFGPLSGRYVQEAHAESPTAAETQALLTEFKPAATDALEGLAELEETARRESEESARKAQQQTERRQHQEQLLNVQAELAQQETHLAARRAEAKTLEKEIQGKRREHSKLDSQIKSLKKRDSNEATRSAQRRSEEKKLLEKLEVLRKQAEAKEAEIKAGEARITERKKQQDQIQNSLQAARESVQKEEISERKLREQVAALGGKVSQLESKLDESRRLEAELDARIELKKLEHTSTETALQAVREALKGKKVDAPELEKMAREKFELWSKSHAEAVGKHGILIKTLEALSKQERKKLEDLERLQQDTDALEARRDAARAELQLNQTALGEAVASLKQTGEKHSHLASEHEHLESRRQELTDQSDKLSKSFASLEDQEKRLRSSIEELEKARDTAESEHKELGTSLQKQTEALAQATHGLKQTEEKHAGLNKAHTALIERQQKLVTQAATLMEEVSGHQTERHRLQNAISELKEAESRAEMAIREKEKAQQDREAALQAAEEKRQALESAHQKLQERQEELTHQIAELSALASSHLTEEQRLQKVVSDLTNAHTAAEIALQKRQNQARDQESALATAAAALKQTEQAHSELQFEHAALESRRDDLTAGIAGLTETIAKHKSEESRVRTAVQEMGQSCAAAEMKLKEREFKLREQDAALSKAMEALKNTEGLRSTAQQECERFKTEHQKLVIDARRLDASIAGRKAEEERLRQDMKEMEARHAAAEAGMNERATLLSEREAAVARATEALKEAGERHAMIIAEIEQFQGQVSRLAAEQQQLSQDRGRLTAENASLASLEKSLRQSVADLEAGEAEARKHHDEQKLKLNAVTASHTDAKSRYESLAKDLESLRMERGGLQTEISNLQSKSKALRSEVEQARFESDQLTSLVENSRTEIENLDHAKAEFLTQKLDLEAQVAQAGDRLESLQGVESKLLKARDEFRKTHEAHAAMTAGLAAITAQRDATSQHATELEQEIGEMRQHRAQLEREVAACQARHEETQREYEEYHVGAETSRQRLDESIQKLETRSADLQARHETVSRKFAEVQGRHAELSEQNQNLEAALRRFEEITVNIRKSEWSVKELEGRRKSLESACTDAQIQVRKLTENQAVLARSIEQLEARSAAEQKELKALVENERRQRERFEELRALNTDAEAAAAEQHKKYEEAIEVMRQEAMLLEARLTRARTWNDDLDKLYAKLATMPEGSPEANQFWNEIQRHKQAIAEQMPASVQLRPGGRQIVPRGRR